MLISCTSFRWSAQDRGTSRGSRTRGHVLSSFVPHEAFTQLKCEFNMSESGGFGGGGGFSSGGDFSGGGGFSSGGDSWGGGNDRGGYSGAAGPSEGGSFGGGFFRSQDDSQGWTPMEAAGLGAVAGYFMGRGTAPGSRSYPWSPQGYYPQQPAAYVFTSPQSSTYAPIVPGAAAYTASRGVPPLGYYHERSERDQPRNRRKKFLKYSFIAAIIVATWLYIFAYGSKTIELREREQHLLTATTLFATAINVAPDQSIWSGHQPASFHASVLTLPEQPALNRVDKFQLGQAGVVVPKYGYQAWPVWLNRGSTVEMSYAMASSSVLHIVIIRGRSEMEQWKEDPNGNDGNHGALVEHQVYGSGSHRFKASQTGLYFFALANFHRDSVPCDFFLSVASTQFDLSKAVDSCDMSSDYSEPCVVDLPLGSSQFAVLASSPGVDPHRPMRTIRVTYSPRGLAYLILLLSPWFLLALYSISMKLLELRKAAAEARATSRDQGALAVLPQVQPGGSGGGSALPAGGGVGGVTGPPPTSKAPIPEGWVASGAPAGAGLVAASAAAAPEVPSELTPLVVAPSAPRLEEDLPVPGPKGAGPKEEGDDACAICMEGKKDAVILDCGHRATCFSCGKM